MAKPGVSNAVRIRISAFYLFFAVAFGALGASGVTLAGEKDRYVSGDNYHATQFHAPGLRDSALDTIKMLIGSDIDAAHGASGDHEGSGDHAESGDHVSADDHGQSGGHGAAAGHSRAPFHQLQCGGFCRSVSGNAINETYEACLGPCFKCNQIAIRAQADHGGRNAETAEKSFETCWSQIPEMGAF